MRIANIVAPALILVSPLPTFLQYNIYGLARPETLLSIALLVGLGLAISGFIALRPETLRPAMIGLLWAYFLDISLRRAMGGTDDWLLEWGWIAERIETVFPVALAFVTISLMVLARFLRRNVGLISSTVFGVILLSSILLPGETLPLGEQRSRAAEPRGDLPPVVHIVLDGQLGPAGLPRDIPGSAALRRELEAFYEAYGFTLFRRSFTSYSRTYESLSNMFNGGTARRTGANMAAVNGNLPLQGMRLRENAWFRRLSDRGYRLRLYHTENIDFCTIEIANVDYCYIFPVNSIQSLDGLDLALDLKARVILDSFLSGSVFYRILAKVARRYIIPSGVGGLLPVWPWEHPAIGGFGALTTLDRMAEDLAAAPRGVAIFAHLLTPHGAFVHDAECRPKPDLTRWLGEENLDAPEPYNQTAASRRERYPLYFDQVRCIHRRLGMLFDRMKELGLFEDATIIVHGDHGSRLSRLIPRRAVADLFTPADLIDVYSVLFAVRKPGLPKPADRRQRSIQNLFGEIFLDRSPSGASEGVFLRVQYRVVGRPFTERPMPRIPD